MAPFQEVPPSILEAKRERRPSDTHEKIDALLASIDAALEEPHDDHAVGG